MKFNIYNKWDTLDTVVLGNFYTPDQFTNDRQKKISEEILEDLEYFKEILKQQCTVLQPKVDTYPLEDQIWRSGFPRAPLYPRDSAVVAGNTCILVADHQATKDCLNAYGNCVDIEHSSELDHLTDPFAIDAPSITVLDDSIIFARHRGYADVISQIFKPYTDGFTHRVLDSHLIHDGRTTFLGPRTMITLEPADVYQPIFPEHEILYVPNSGKRNVIISAFSKMKEPLGDRLRSPSDADYDYFLDAWDYFREYTYSVFDANLISLDPHTVCMTNNANTEVKQFLAKNKIDVIEIPFRHRYLHEGGLHCMTLDLKRR